MRLVGWIGMGAMAAALAGCAAPAALTVASYAADGASVMATGRSVSDHGLSILLKKDCALFRVVQGKAVCRPMTEDDPVYAIAFAHRTYDYSDPDDPSLAGAVEPVPEAPSATAPVMAAASPQPASPAPGSAPEAPPVVAVAAVSSTPAPASPPTSPPSSAPASVGAPKPASVGAPRSASASAVVPAAAPAAAARYRVVAGAFNELSGASTRRRAVRAQLRRMGLSDVEVLIVEMPADSAANYAVVTRLLEEGQANVLLGQLQLNQGDSPWKMRSEGPAL